MLLLSMLQRVGHRQSLLNFRFCLSSVLLSAFLPKRSLRRLLVVSSFLGLLQSNYDHRTIAYAQVIPDNTLGVNGAIVVDGVRSNGQPAQLVDGGLQRNSNLFHSFSDFNLAETDVLYFINPADVEYIFARVTGGNISTLKGLLGVDGPADFYLANPAGVIFGDNASLDVQGAVFVTTGDAISFADGTRFEANGMGDSGLLTVSVPLGLQYQPSSANAAINITGANLVSPESLNFVADTLSITDSALTGRSGISLQGGTLSLKDGTRLRTGTDGANDAGPISLVAAGSISVNNNVEFLSETRSSGNGGDITLIAPSGAITLTDNVEVRSGNRRRATGDAGDIWLQGATVTLADNVEVRAEADGNAGNIRIEALTGVLSLEDDAEIITESFEQGNAGNIVLIAHNSEVRLQDDIELRSSLRGDGSGRAGNISIQGSSVLLEGRDDKNKVELRAASRGDDGDVGHVLIEAVLGDLTIQDFVDIKTESTEEGDGGDVTLRARNGDIDIQDNIEIITSVVSASGDGDAGSVLIDAQFISIQDNTSIQARNDAAGDGGNITLQAQGDIVLDGTERSVGLFSSLEKNATSGRAGDISLSGQSVEVLDATLQANSLGQGDAGNVVVNATETALFSGVRTLVFSRLNAGAVGSGGNIEITAPSIVITDKAQLTAGTSGQGDAGNVVVRTDNLLVTDNAQILTITFDNGNGGKIQIEAPRGIVRLENGGRLVSGVEGAGLGNGGDIEINTGELILVDGGRVVTSTDGVIPAVLLASIEDLEYTELVQEDQPLVYWSLERVRKLL